MADIASLGEMLKTMAEAQTKQHAELLARTSKTDEAIEGLLALKPAVAALETNVADLHKKMDSKYAECMEAVEKLKKDMTRSSAALSDAGVTYHMKSGFSNSISITNENDVWDLVRVHSEGTAVWNQTDCEDWGITADLMAPITNMLNL
ncbi:unnamed protein product, partial [Prorocentrum cordatum]